MSKLVQALLLITSLTLASLWADIKSDTGIIHFDVNSNNANDFTINGNGLGIGTENAASTNLHVVGNAIIENGNFGIGTTDPKHTLEISGSLGYAAQTVTGSENLEGNTFILADTSAGNITLTLPSSSGVTGRKYLIKKTHTANRLIVTGDRIDNLNLLSFESSSNMQAIKLQSSGNGYDIASIYGSANTISSDNLIGWWGCDETSGDNLFDLSGNSNTATLLSGAGLTMGSNGQVGLALETTNAVFRIDPLRLPDDSAWTVSWWAHVNDNSGAKGFYGHNFGAGVYTRTLITGTTLSLYNDANQLVNWGGVVPTGSWNHYVITCDGTDSNNINFYYNNTAQAVRTLADSSQTIRHFPSYGGSPNYVGVFDDFRVYTRQLSTQEIDSLYDLGR